MRKFIGGCGQFPVAGDVHFVQAPLTGMLPIVNRNSRTACSAVSPQGPCTVLFVVSSSPLILSAASTRSWETDVERIFKIA